MTNEDKISGSCIFVKCLAAIYAKCIQIEYSIEKKHKTRIFLRNYVKTKTTKTKHAFF